MTFPIDDATRAEFITPVADLLDSLRVKVTDPFQFACLLQALLAGTYIIAAHLCIQKALDDGVPVNNNTFDQYDEAHLNAIGFVCEMNPLALPSIKKEIDAIKKASS